MIDIHTHVLPAIDDGADSLDTAAAMCRLAAAQGCTALVATPHQRTPTWWNCEPEGLARGLDRLRERSGNALGLHLGAEIRVDSGLLDALVTPQTSGIVSLAGSRYLLLEFNRHGFGRVDPEALTHELVLQSWRPIFAHPELITELAKAPELMHRIVERGGLFQVTAMSLTGDFGRKTRNLTEKMVADGLVHFVASDAHDPIHRPPGLRRAHDFLSSRFETGLADRLTRVNPLAVLENRPIGDA